MRRFRSVVSVFVCLFFLINLSSCMSFGTQFPSQTAWIIKDQTSQQDVLMVLGEPYAVGSSNGVPVWTYLFSDYKVWQPIYQKELKIYWTDGSIVKHYQFNSSFPEDLIDTARYARSQKKSAPVQR